MIGGSLTRPIDIASPASRQDDSGQGPSAKRFVRALRVDEGNLPPAAGSTIAPKLRAFSTNGKIIAKPGQALGSTHSP